MIKIFKQLKLRDWIAFSGLFILSIFQVIVEVRIPLFTAELVTQMQEKASAQTMLSTGMLMLGYALAVVILVVIVTFLGSSIGTNLAKNTRLSLFQKVESFSLDDMNHFQTSSLITRATNDVQQVASSGYLMLRMGLTAPLLAVLAIVRIAQTSSELTWVAAVAVTFLLSVIMTIMVFVIPKFKIIQKLIDKMNGVTRDHLTGIRFVKAYRAEDFHKDRFENVNEELVKNQIFTNRLTALVSPTMMLVNYSVSIAIYWLGTWIILRNQTPAFFAQMFAFTQLISQVIMAFMLLIMLFMMLPRAQVSANRIHEVLDWNNVKSKSRHDKPGNYHLSVHKVSFRYPDASEDCLSDISFELSTGKTLGIIGPTGSGKTTLAYILANFFQRTQGDILFDHHDIDTIDETTLRKHVAIVPQKSILFTGTIKENIELGISLTDEEVLHCLEIADAKQFILDKEDGLLSPVSQGGKNFSGGQKQRLSIARAIARNPQFIIFDDSFSALDYATDLKVRENIQRHFPETSKIIIGQRVASIMHADHILMLNNGKIIGQGTHDELINSCEEYQLIALSQMSKLELGL